MKAWHWTRNQGVNFGDELGPLLLRELGFEVEDVKQDEADIVLGGSTIQLLTKVRSGTKVWGSGLIGAREPARLDLDYLCVRGNLTAARLGLDDVPLGDPGILTSFVYPVVKTRYEVGYVPHYIDNHEMIDRPKDSYNIKIDVTADPLKAIEQIASCRTIISSSLHGLIVANSYGIPAMRLMCGSITGGDFKFIDYASNTSGVRETQERLLEALENSGVV